MAEFFIQPLECGWVGRLVVWQVEFLDGQVAEQAANDLLGQIVGNQVIIDRHSEKARCVKRCHWRNELAAENLIHSVREYIQRGARQAQGLFSFQDALVDVGKPADRSGQRHL